eukprot:3711962-Amphidinium_carterae.1
MKSQQCFKHVWVPLLHTIDVITNSQTTRDAVASCFCARAPGMPLPRVSAFGRCHDVKFDPKEVSAMLQGGCRCLVFLRLANATARLAFVSHGLGCLFGRTLEGSKAGFQ